MAEHLGVGEDGERNLGVRGIAEEEGEVEGRRDSEKIQFGSCQIELKALGALRSWQSGY